MDDRQSVLEALVSFKHDISFLESQVSRLDWDSDEELVFIDLSHLKHVLQGFINDRLTKEDIYKWANMIEMREDIGFKAGYEDQLKELIFELANPEITNELSINRASELMRKL